MDSILFSVLVPAYKSVFLRECIDSILAQTYTNFELIIVDDDSPEDLGSIVGAYRDTRIKYYKNEKNIGAVNLVDNWNKCLSYAKGDYVICMGDDDKLLPNCLEEYKKLIDMYPGIGLLHGWTEIIDEESVPYQMTTMRGLHESAYSLCWHRVNGIYQRQFVGDFCYERAWLTGHGGFYKVPLAWGSDDISAIIGASKNGIANTQVPVFQYRVNKYSVSSTGNASIKLEAIDQTLAWHKTFLKGTCDNTVDELFRRNTLEVINRRFDNKKGYVITLDLFSKGLFRIIHWLRCGHEYGLSRRVMAYAMLMYFKDRRND